MCCFLDQFAAGLRMLCQDFVEEILKAYNIEMYHLTPNGITKIGLFIWAVKSQDANLDIRAFVLSMRCILNLETKWLKGKILLSILVVAVSSLLVLLNILH